MIIASDLTHNGTGLCVNINDSIFGSTTFSSYTTKGSTAISIASLPSDSSVTSSQITSFSNCALYSYANTTNAILLTTGGLTESTRTILNLSNCVLYNSNTTEANDTTRYIYLAGTGGTIIIQRTMIATASTTPTSITPFQTAYSAGSGLYYYGNTYVGSTTNIIIARVLPSGWGLGVSKLTSD